MAQLADLYIACKGHSCFCGSLASGMCMHAIDQLLKPAEMIESQELAHAANRIYYPNKEQIAVTVIINKLKNTGPADDEGKVDKKAWALHLW